MGVLAERAGMAGQHHHLKFGGNLSGGWAWRAPGRSTIRIGATIGNFIVIGLVAATGALLAFALLQLWAGSNIVGSGLAHDILIPVGAAFNYSTKGL